MKRAFFSLTSIAAGSLLIGILFSSHAAGKGSQVTAILRNSRGQVVGNATFTPVSKGVKVSVQVNNLNPGWHGIHIHEFGQCTPPDFKSAGDHFNPLGKKHGLRNSGGPHVGDLPNLWVNADGHGSLTAVAHDAVFGDQLTSLFLGSGTSLVIHAKEDDEKSQPSGKAGGRIACGAIKRTK